MYDPSGPCAEPRRRGGVTVASDLPETVEFVTEIESRGADLRPCIERALALGGRPVHRLGSAGTSVTFRVLPSEELSVTLLLDRHPPEVVDGSEPAEITIELDGDQAERFARGELVLPNCILRGEVACRGPVRKYLTLDPILRALLARVCGGGV